MLKHILFTCLLSFSVTPLLKAQNCGNDEIYHLPYKNTYVKEPLVTENEYRVANPRLLNRRVLKKLGRYFPIRFGMGMEKKWKCIGGHGK